MPAGNSIFGIVEGQFALLGVADDHSSSNRAIQMPLVMQTEHTGLGQEPIGAHDSLYSMLG